MKATHRDTLQGAFVWGALVGIAVSGCGQLANDQGSRGAARSALTADFRDGVSPSAAWAGAADTNLHEDSPDANFGSATTLRADGDQPSGSGLDRAILLRWDVSLIPPAATVTKVTTTVNITAAVITATYEMYELRRPWVEAEATWNRASTTTAWQQPGALGPMDRGAAVLGIFNGQTVGPYVVSWTDAGVSLVQAWVSGAANFGVIIHDTTHTNGQEFSSREAPPADRPLLTVTYALPPDAGASDAGASDAGASDAGASDAGASDAGASDAGASDAGASDAGASDAGASDAGASDAGASDAGASDAGASDAGASDAGASDAGASDAGADEGLRRPSVLGVACGCGTTPLTAGCALALLAARRRRISRHI